MSIPHECHTPHPARGAKWNACELRSYDRGALAAFAGIDGEDAPPDPHPDAWIEGWRDGVEPRPGSRAEAIIPDPR